MCAYVYIYIYLQTSDGNYQRDVTFSFFVRDVPPLFRWKKKGSIVCLMICEGTFSPIKKKKKKKESSFLGKGGASTISEFNLDPMNNLNNGGGVLRKFLAL